MPRWPERSTEQRFWEKVDQTGDCWLWTAGTRKGYGLLQVGTHQHPRQIYAHRFAYELLVGPIPEGLELDHFTCFNHACVNPAHLRPATRRQNGRNLSGQRANNTSGVQGVYWEKSRQRWHASVQQWEGPTIFVGRFRELEDAEAAVRAKRSEIYGQEQEMSA